MAENLVLSYPAFTLTEKPVEQFRAELKDYFLQTAQLYETLFEVINDDRYYTLRPCALRHPLIFYFGHTATFFVNKLVIAKQLTRINPLFESMFAIGVDEMSWDDLNEAHYDWPSVDAVRAYRQQAKAAILALIERVEIRFPITWQGDVWPILMGIEHERIHLETSSVLIRQLPIACVQPHPLFPICPAQSTPVPEQRWLDVPAGKVSIDHQDPAHVYGWDNEYGKHEADIAAFQAANMLVSNADFLLFVQADGYQTPRYWTEEGQGWLSFTQAQQPSFWLQSETGYRLRTLFSEIDMPWSWPAEVNYLEAKAYCNWLAETSGKPVRLPSEDEYLHLRAQCHLPQSETTLGMGANLNLAQWASSTPVDANLFGDVYDIVGNVWQWTETPIYPFEGFKVHPLYDDFTVPTFDNKHNLFKGGSWISSGNEANLHSRYAFRRHFFQHAGFRPIISDAPVQTYYTPIENQSDVAMACEADYGASYFALPNYASSLAAWVKLRPEVTGRVLVLGCSVGRICFELAQVSQAVTGLDFSARFIAAADQLQQSEPIRYRLSLEGDVPEFVERRLSDVGLSPSPNLHFMQQDPNNLKSIFTGYDVILLNGILAQLIQPKAFLSHIAQRLNAGGILMIADDYAPQTRAEGNARLGGYKQDGENVLSAATIAACLSHQMQPVGDTIDIVRVLRSDARHYALANTQVCCWQAL